MFLSIVLICSQFNQSLICINVRITYFVIIIVSHFHIKKCMLLCCCYPIYMHKCDISIIKNNLLISRTTRFTKNNEVLLKLCCPQLFDWWWVWRKVCTVSKCRVSPGTIQLFRQTANTQGLPSCSLPSIFTFPQFPFAKSHFVSPWRKGMAVWVCQAGLRGHG